MSNGRITVELDTKIDNLLSAANARITSPGWSADFDSAREALEAAIDEAITRGKAEPNAEPAPESSASDLIDALEAEAEALSYKPMAPKRTESYLAARSALERYMSTLERERADAINRYNSADAARVNLKMRLADAEKERDALRVQMEQMREQLSDELEAAADEIARLEQTLASCDSIKLAEELEAMRVERAGLQADLGIARGERDYAREIIKNTGARVSDHAERLRVMRGWLDVLAQGYLTPEGVTAGARKAIDALTVIIRDITGNPKG